MKRLLLAGAVLGALASSAYADNLQPFVASGYTVTPLSTTTTSATATLPNGTQSALLQNVGGDGVFCAVGSTATTSGVYLSPSGGSFILPTTGSEQVSCIDQSTTSTINIIPGSGFSVVASGGGTSGSSGASSAVYPSGGSAGSSNGIGSTDANAFDTTFSGADLAGYSPPCTQPAGYGSKYFWQCLLKGVYSGIFFNNNSHYQSAALENSHAVKASAGSLFGFYCTAITGGTAGYCEATNTTTAVTSGAATPLDVCYFTTAAGCSLSRIPIGISYGTGISVTISSNASPFTVTTGTLTGFIGADYQ